MGIATTHFPLSNTDCKVQWTDLEATSMETKSLMIDASKPKKSYSMQCDTTHLKIVWFPWILDIDVTNEFFHTLNNTSIDHQCYEYRLVLSTLYCM